MTKIFKLELLDFDYYLGDRVVLCTEYVHKKIKKIPARIKVAVSDKKRKDFSTLKATEIYGYFLVNGKRHYTYYNMREILEAVFVNIDDKTLYFKITAAKN